MGTKAATTLHPRNRHQGRYDLAALVELNPALAPFVQANPAGEATIDFADPQAVRLLNAALLQQHYGIRFWDLPAGYLCPPIPGRADYLHYLADLLAEDHGGEVPRGGSVRVLDVGVGANCIYPLIGQAEYGWRFVGSDIDPQALETARVIVGANGLGKQIELRLQPDPQAIFQQVVKARDQFDLVLCNPPFHASAEEARAGSARKWRNLGRTQPGAPLLNFGGQSNELWCPGGEAGFLLRMVAESRELAGQCHWFSSLVSRAETLNALRPALRRAGAVDVRTVAMAQGQKQSRFIAWRFAREAEPPQA
ncbi:MULTISPECIES: 23S rRNA (adenine(1618)-N(6))-methyltransferase RlmF [unclassified Paludibacterium]|uniref:23S rRNA (adenine(1618)-N(6))-methyltransferase RlmF n=1 Tax=unclassified Paludibacterium TaxID=2618429 RepID=UPI001C05536A|nr:23S rRNA (adenine(1618)-N(6))-methyltransferase RlmF [Paludibacterium sp. B53371]BEV73522.1 23S rRNA (adenine(1618)-N(6))-methyltransferase RlmF [Paludibacterium sp. THUN1379]